MEYISGYSDALVPLGLASVYSELGLSVAICTLQHIQEDFDDALTLSEAQFTHPLLYDAVPHPGRDSDIGQFASSWRQACCTFPISSQV